MSDYSDSLTYINAAVDGNGLHHDVVYHRVESLEDLQLLMATPDEWLCRIPEDDRGVTTLQGVNLLFRQSRAWGNKHCLIQGMPASGVLTVELDILGFSESPNQESIDLLLPWLSTLIPMLPPLFPGIPAVSAVELDSEGANHQADESETRETIEAGDDLDESDPKRTYLTATVRKDNGRAFLHTEVQETLQAAKIFYAILTAPSRFLELLKKRIPALLLVPPGATRPTSFVELRDGIELSLAAIEDLVLLFTLSVDTKCCQCDSLLGRYLGDITTLSSGNIRGPLKFEIHSIVQTTWCPCPKGYR